ncbi:MAG: DUF3109 family protein [Bacteroidia bacterium]|nr:DUF3109 family protein [Bacteroidia bacterium]NNC85894.1 DUF3109 family protein [Bacteroidia bacterium]NNM15141.1 DUF3109 family protein [Bacteroidia bacterium]
MYPVIEIDDTLVSGEVISEAFVCDLQKCKGACCVQGESGAPLEKEELAIIKKNYKKIEPFLNDKGKNAIEKQGHYIKDEDGDWVTPLVAKDKECAYTVFEDGLAKCGIEKAYEAGEIKFKKPISCHLYPIRTQQLKSYEAVNYHRWDICSAACKLGSKLSVPVYKFLKDPLIRKYGSAWYKKLERVAKHKNW